MESYIYNLHIETSLTEGVYMFSVLGTKSSEGNCTAVVAACPRDPHWHNGPWRLLWLQYLCCALCGPDIQCWLPGRFCEECTQHRGWRLTRGKGAELFTAQRMTHHRFCCWTLTWLLCHQAWLWRGYLCYRNLIDWLINSDEVRVPVIHMQHQESVPVNQMLKTVYCLQCYEWALRKAQQLDWSEDSAKAFVMIGDCAPHEVSYTTLRINWHEELEVLVGMGVKVTIVVSNIPL